MYIEMFSVCPLSAHAESRTEPPMDSWLGRGAIFADCGLGKTPMQLEWAHRVYERTGRPVLILTPLAVGLQTVEEAHKFGFDAAVSRTGSLSGAPITSAAPVVGNSSFSQAGGMSRGWVVMREMSSDWESNGFQVGHNLQLGDAGYFDVEREAALLYERFGSYEEVARRTNLDRRTVKAYLEKAR